MFPQRLKPQIDFVVLTARLEAAPFQNKVVDRIFQQPARGEQVRPAAN
jgi:hypothetical protein